MTSPGAPVAVVVHAQRPEAVELARRACSWLAERGHRVVVPTDDFGSRPDAVSRAEPGGWTSDEAVIAADGALDPAVELVLAIGGDGTMLRAVGMATGTERDPVPVLGVNVGDLGYLTQADPGEWADALARWRQGDLGVEERMLIRVAVRRAGGSDTPETATGPTWLTGLNELVVEKAAKGHTVRLDVELDGRFFTSYAADGMIVASPTGSTAYSLSARGPIVDPTHRALLVTPVSPHMLFDRTLVLNPSTEVRLVVRGHRTAALSVDGRGLADLADGDTVVCTAAERPAQLVTTGSRDFHGILKTKFQLGDR